ncbi:MAG: hypothetical protein ABIP39_01705 [Polyangiaceae bacterium]
MLLLRLVTISLLAVTIASCRADKADPVDACGAYFDAQVQVQARCGQTAALAPDENARERTRFLAACKLTLDEPGTGMTADWLNACANSIKTDLCSNVQFDPACTTPTGGVETGQPCSSHAQCQTGICGGPGTGGACGTCSPVLRTGDACVPGGPPCNKSAQCDQGTCVAVVRGELGASCDRGKPDCKTGICDIRTHACALPLLAGSPCSSDWECADNLTCSGFACTPVVAEGAACAVAVGSTPSSAPCPVTLVCSQSTKTCVGVHVAKGGEACDVDVTRCELGSCSGGTCPKVLADGDPCEPSSGTTTCDFFAECKDGKCVTGSFTPCK